MKYPFLLLFSLQIISQLNAQKEPLKLGVVGLSHGHVGWILGYEGDDVEVVGYVEDDKDLVAKYAKQYGFPMSKVYNSVKELKEKTQVEAVAAFGSTFEHLEVVKESAPLGLHIMVEKPLAVSLEHAREMARIAEENGVYLITNYETTWYATNHKAKALLDKGKVGDFRKLIVYDGHRGPKKIGVNEEFLDWLTDPVLNGAGALTDFGCYGANLATWIQKGEKPIAVTAITQQLQAENNPMVDDECIIILEYENSNALLQPSWNWPMGRKDMEIYGLTGAIYADNGRDLRVRIAEGYDGFDEEKMRLEERESPYDNPFSFFTALIRKDISMEKFDLSTIENNLIVVEILDAARESARTGKKVYLEKK